MIRDTTTTSESHEILGLTEKRNPSHLPVTVYVGDGLSHDGDPGPQYNVPILENFRQDGDLSNDDRAKKHGTDDSVFRIVSSIQDADVCFLPMNWNYYLQQKCIQPVISFAERVQAAGKLVVVWANGDFEKIIPIRNAVQFQSGLNRSRKRLPVMAFEVPAFVWDSVDVYLNGELQIRKKQAKPRIGFCGQARGRLPGLMVWLKQGLKLRGLSLIGQAQEVPPPLQPPWLLRVRALDLLSKSHLVETEFIIRDRYRAGIRRKEERNDPFHATNVEFVNNILNTDYTVCLRGGGNFSKRLYETFCCGRIPIFVDTDCVLPYDFRVDWEEYCVWIHRGEIPHIAETVADFHAALSPGDFEEMQRKGRQFWVDRLSKQGFFAHFHEHFSFLYKDQGSEPGHARQKWTQP